MACNSTTVFVVGLVAGCADPAAPSGVDALTRASMTVRGIRPSPEEIAAVAADPDAIGAIVRAYLDDPAFGDTIRDLHAEQLLLRWDTRGHLAPVGPLAGYDQAAITRSTDEEPLRLIDRIVTTGRPYTDIVTTASAMADPIVATAYGVPYDDAPDAPVWQESTWSDGRPPAGILSSTSVWQRHMSSITNHHRGRASLVLSTLLCEPLPAGSVVSDPTVTTLGADPACAGCHGLLDPLASSFYGFVDAIVPSDNVAAELAGCPSRLAGDCMPLRMWDPVLKADRDVDGMPAAELDGATVDDVAALGRAIAADPRFATCTAKRFVSYFEQVPVEAVDDARAEALADVLVDAGWDARALVLAIALDPGLAPAAGRVGPLQVRPEQLARMIYAETGFAWTAAPDGYGAVDLLTTDQYGYRLLLGGIDGWDSIRPVYHPTATRELALAGLAERAAAYAVDTGRLPIGGLVTERGEVRGALRDLYIRLTGQPDAALDDAVALFEGAYARSNDPAAAWKVTLTALLLDPRAVTY